MAGFTASHRQATRFRNRARDGRAATAKGSGCKGTQSRTRLYRTAQHARGHRGKPNARGIFAGSVAAGVTRNRSVKLTLSSAHLTESESRCVIVNAECHNPSRELCGKLDSLVRVRALRFFFCATGVSFFLAPSLHGLLL